MASIGTTPVERRDVQTLVQDLDSRRALDVACGDRCRATSVEAQRDLFVGFRREDDVFQVEDDVGDIFADTLNGVELVQCVVETNSNDRRAGNAAEQRAAQRVTDRVAEAGLERADSETLTRGVVVADGFDCWALNNEHDVASAGEGGWITWSTTRR